MELAALFQQRNLSILDRAQRDEITPATNPNAQALLLLSFKWDVLQTMLVRPCRHHQR